MRRRGGASVFVILAVGLAGCGRLGLGDPLAGSHQTTYEPLTPAPTTPVTSSALPPPAAVSEQPLGPAPGVATAPGTYPPGTAVPGTPMPGTTTAPTNTQVAVTNDKAPPIGRGEFVGAWRIASGADNCQLFVSLTSWAGGYRASTKGCNSAELQRISAWDLAGKQVSLKGGDGGILATLSGAGPERFAGTTTSRQAITLSR
ncbi:MAG: AprI/Inh family metalloprotease inhibitor [Ancalomicrobiaceae bacterium]|nr:AprI/Inh family metalloprotease inhibitor [Ancalomicrobiaceae bacterium]